MEKAQSKEDKQRIKNAVKPFYQDENYQVVYAHWEEQESYGRTVRTTFFRYVIVFFEKTLHIYPARIDKNTRQIQLARPYVLGVENLGKVTVDVKRKNDQLKRLEVWLGDKQGHTIIQFRTDVLNLRKNKWFPLNLIQQEECEKFEAFISSLAQDVAKENPRIDLIMSNEANDGVGIIGIILSVIGAVAGIFLPPLGLILCVIGFALSLASKLKGSSNKKSFITCTILMILSIFFFIFYYKVMFA